MNTEATRTKNTERDGTVPFRFRVGGVPRPRRGFGGQACQFSVSSGFTVIELLLSLAIIAVISAIGISAMSPVNTDKALITETEKVLSLIVKARSQTLAAKEDSVYGVHFEERKAVLFKGPTYSAGAAGNQIQALHDEVKISALALNGSDSEVVFSKLTGATAQSGTVTLSTLRDAGKTKVITITATGSAYSN